MNILDLLKSTTQQFRRVFMCESNHVYPAVEILKFGTTVCPECGKSVKDVTDTPLGQSYFAFARPDLGK